MSRSLIRYFILLALMVGIIVFVNSRTPSAGIEKERENVYVIERAAGEQKPQKEPATVTQFRPLEMKDLSSEQIETINFATEGVLIAGDLIVIVPPSGSAHNYAFIKQERTAHEVKIIVRKVPTKTVEPLLGSLSIEGFVPIGIYDEEGHFLQ